MFDQINGLPVHVLLVHAAVVFVPLLALSAVTYAVVPRLRSRIGWAAALLAVGAPAAALFAKLSGEAFRDRLAAGGLPADSLQNIATHEEYGELTFWIALALGVVTGLMVFVTSRGAGLRQLPRAANLALTVVVVVLAAVASYYVFMTGDTGARSVYGA